MPTIPASAKAWKRHSFFGSGEVSPLPNKLGLRSSAVANTPLSPSAVASRYPRTVPNPPPAICSLLMSGWPEIWPCTLPKSCAPFFRSRVCEASPRR